jgi:hypothetical protein
MCVVGMTGEILNIVHVESSRSLRPLPAWHLKRYKNVKVCQNSLKKYWQIIIPAAFQVLHSWKSIVKVHNQSMSFQPLPSLRL